LIPVNNNNIKLIRIPYFMLKTSKDKIYEFLEQELMGVNNQIQTIKCGETKFITPSKYCSAYCNVYEDCETPVNKVQEGYIYYKKNNMKKIVRLTESDLTRLVKRVIRETNSDMPRRSMDEQPEDIDSEDYFPIHTDYNESYTFHGKLTDDCTYPSIFTHPIKIIHADDEPLVERVMEVSASEKRWVKRVAFMQKNGDILAWNDAETLEDAKKVTTVTSWRFAREIPPVNPRIAEIESQIQRLQNELETLKEVSK
jgi:hypothetical protein